MSYIAITIRAAAAQTDLLIAQLSELKYEGFEEQTDALIAYIPAGDFEEAALQELLQAHGVTYTKETILPVNWNAVWESNFQPVQVDGFCGIRAEFHPPFDPQPVHEIIITPKMAFGTGHHATTASMIKLMEQLDFKGKRVFDFGTGTGILAILAEMMGATVIDAIDYDEWSVNNTLENMAANAMSRVKVWQADNLVAITGKYDILLANINYNILMKFMGDMYGLLVPGGKLLLSGILPTDEENITAEAVSKGFTRKGRIEKDNWLALRFYVPEVK